ncbi:MAG: AAA family ATPase [Chloroflexota bacterium]|nr:AAA family ATPase [Chloroflexota bacterium]
MEPDDRDAERRARFTATVPAPLAEKMRSFRPAGERRPVTALLADVVGSTGLTERMDPEDWTAIVNEAFDVMSRAIFRYEGTIARLMGDGILAFFGAPVAHEDDPERAVRCALDMVHAIDATLRERVLREHGAEFRIRAGINTGTVVVGVVGSDLAYEYTAMGDAVNVAARMQNAARPGTVLATAATHRFVASLVDATPVGPLEVKGKAEPLDAFEITGLRSRPASVRGLAGIESPMVGREAQLDELMRAFAVVRAGRGRAACIVGDPGMGKSRLIAELRSRARREVGEPNWIEGRCLSYGKDLAYHLLTDLVRSAIGVSAAARETEIRAALAASTRELPPDGRADAYAYLGHLLGVQLAADELARVSGIEMETVKRYVASFHQLLRMLTVRGPLVLVCEDVHWADRSSVGALGELLSIVDELPVLVVIAARPDRAAPGWELVTVAQAMFGDVLVEIRLAPLTPDESRALVGNLLAIESLPERVREYILGKAEGNPFFVEEVIRMLIDRGAIVRQDDRWVATSTIEGVEIPDTLHGLLLARIDRLPESSKRTLRVASVIGRQFAVRVLRELVP